jgi:DNA (cytosine-5)-methyltransferase 1
LRFIDYFSGAGGLSTGLKSVGLESIYYNEIDAVACKSLRNNLTFLGEDPKKVIELPIEHLHKKLLNKKIKLDFQSQKVVTNDRTKNLYKNYKNFELNSIRFEDLTKEAVGEVDLMVGGPPCQGFSAAARGKKKVTNYKGFIDDPRNQLFKYYIDLVAYYEPKYVLIENVNGLKSALGYKDSIIKSLKNAGKTKYDVAFLSINCSDFGVPQNRDRVFFVGIRKDLPDSNTISFYLPSILLRRATLTKRTLGDAVEDLPQIKSNPKKLNTKKENEIEIGNVDSFGENISTSSYENLVALSEYSKTINSYRGKIILPKKLFNHKCRFNNDDDLKIFSLLKPGLTLKNPENKEALKLVKYDTSAFGDKYFKLSKDSPSRTIVAHLENDNNGYIHYGNIPRGISPREAARIQSFPDWYFFEGGIGKQYKQIGNAVPPLIGRLFGEIFNIIDKNGLEGLLNLNSKKVV